MSFEQQSQVTLRDRSGGRSTFEANVADGWQQGAGAFGGYVFALLVRSLEGSVPGRALRSLTAEIAAPVKPGPVQIVVEVLRAGQSVTTASARLIQDGEIAAHAVAVLGAGRALRGVDDRCVLSRPEARDWRTLEPIPADAPLLPTFAKHFEFRLSDGIPFTGKSPAEATGWIWLRELPEDRDSALLTAHVDAWWPAEFVHLSAPRPIVTSAFSMQVVGGARRWTTNSPLLHTARTLAVGEGYITEHRELWTEEGGLIALNVQTMVVVK